jgi:hypothetical protein
MHPSEIYQYLRPEAFKPFRLHISDGASYEVRHPEMVLVTRSHVAIATDSADGEIPDRMVLCDPLHVTRIEPLKEANTG